MTEIWPAKRNSRVMTKFMAIELLYEFELGLLDEMSRQSVQRFLDDPEVKIRHEEIKLALGYLQALSTSDITFEAVQMVRRPTTYFHLLLQKMKFEQWPDSVRVFVQIGISVSLAILVISLVPWGRMLTSSWWQQSGPLVLAEFTKNSEPSPVPLNASQDLPIFEDDIRTSGLKDGGSKSRSEEAIVKPSSTEVEEKPLSANAPTASAPGSPVLSPKTQQVAASNRPVQPTTTQQVPAVAVSSQKGQGYLFRGSMEVVNNPFVTAKLIALITNLGGRRAGEVQLGWKKGRGSYFHFTIPEAKFDELKKGFEAYGSLKISKEKHPRVMPDGILRLIIQVDEKKKP